MNKEYKMDIIFDELIKKGSDVSYLKNIRIQILELIKSECDLSYILNNIAKEVKEKTYQFLNQQNIYGTNYISGISACIYFPDFNNNGEYKLKLIGGKRNRYMDLKVNDNTLFDIASITKLYTLLLLFVLEKKGFIDLNKKICEINDDFQNLEDYTLNDLIKMHGELRTNGNIALATSQEEAYRILKTVYLSSNTREENKYNDFGAIIIGNTIEKVMSRFLGKQITFDEIMKKYLLDPMLLFNTQYNPFDSNLSGNGNEFGLVHDPKARILGKALGHAGIFTTSDDLARLSKEIYSVNYYNKSLLNKLQLKRLGEITFPNSNQSNKGNLGIYVKHPLGYKKTFTPPEFSTGSFSHQGWTGSVAVFDPNNLIHYNILVNAIYEDDNKEKVINNKPAGFGSAFQEYQKQITCNIMLMYIAKEYFNRYCNVKENINITKYI